MSHVEGVSVDQGFLGRSPFELRKKLVEQIEALEKPAAKKR